MAKMLTRALVVLLSLILATLGSVGIARADAIHIQICMTLDDYPNISGVTGVINGLIDTGYTARQAGYLMGQAVVHVCPEHKALVLRYANAMSEDITIA